MAASSRRSCTNSASSASCALSWNSSKRRQSSRTSSAARSALGAPEPLVGLALRQVEQLELGLGAGARLLAALGCELEHSCGRDAGIEVLGGIDAARDLQQRLAAPSALVGQQPVDTIEPA